VNMFGLFESVTVTDPRLGKLAHSRGLWLGTIALGAVDVPLALSGSRTAPDPQAVQMARAVIEDYDAWRASIRQALFDHYQPYADAIAAEDGKSLRIASPDQVWPHARAVFVQIIPLDGALTVEIGYEVAWDEEHTLGARLREGLLLEVCGSVLRP
jgi:hypothetical protein